MSPTTPRVRNSRAWTSVIRPDLTALASGPLDPMPVSY